MWSRDRSSGGGGRRYAKRTSVQLGVALLAGALLAGALLGVALIGGGLAGGAATRRSPPVLTRAAFVIPDRGCTVGWPYRVWFSGSLDQTVVVCESASDSLDFTNDGSGVVGMQVLVGAPTFGDPTPVTAEQLTVYGAVMSAITNAAGARVHVLLPGKSVVVSPGLGYFRIALTSSLDELATAYAAQWVGGWAYSKVFPVQALIANVTHCAAGLGQLYTNLAAVGHVPTTLQLISWFWRLYPCVAASRQVTSRVGGAPDYAEPERLPTTDDAPASSAPVARAPIASRDPLDLSASERADINESLDALKDSELASESEFTGALADAIETVIRIH